MRNLSYENEYDLHSNGLVSKTHFHMKDFALGLVLKQRQKRTREWPIEVHSCVDTFLLDHVHIFFVHTFLLDHVVVLAPDLISPLHAWFVLYSAIFQLTS